MKFRTAPGGKYKVMHNDIDYNTEYYISSAKRKGKALDILKFLITDVFESDPYKRNDKGERIRRFMLKYTP